MSSSASSFDSSPRFLPLPPGTYTLLPLVTACDNVELPSGPWTAQACKARFDLHRASAEPVLSNGNSAIADESDDEEEPASEFLVPFFVALPPSPTRPRRPSTSTNSSFRLAPLPTLRSSSPTPSHPTSLRTPSSPVPAQPIGFLRPTILAALIHDNAKMVAMNCKPVWSFLPPLSLPPPPAPPSRRSSFSRPGSRRRSSSLAPLTPASQPGTPAVEGNEFVLKDVMEGLKSAEREGKVGTWAVGFEDWVNEEGASTRREHVDRVVRGWKMAGEFADALGGWRDEEYAVYGPVKAWNEEENPLPGSNVAFSMERSACALFGVATFGVHCTAYIEQEGEPLKLWVPRRSATKQTWPSYLDNTVAGGITSGDLPRESVIRECAEEASLPPSFVSSALRAVSVLSYTYRTEMGWIQPEVQYIFDLPLPVDGSVVPSTNPEDGEVESFELMELEEVVRRMVEGEFKPNCAMVLVDFLIRHGYVTPESDTRFLEVATRLRRQLVLPGPA